MGRKIEMKSQFPFLVRAQCVVVCLVYSVSKSAVLDSVTQAKAGPLTRRSKFHSFGGRLAPKRGFRLQSTVTILFLCWLHSPCE